MRILRCYWWRFIRYLTPRQVNWIIRFYKRLKFISNIVSVFSETYAWLVAGSWNFDHNLNFRESKNIPWHFFVFQNVSKISKIFGDLQTHDVVSTLIRHRTTLYRPWKGYCRAQAYSQPWKTYWVFFKNSDRLLTTNYFC